MHGGRMGGRVGGRLVWVLVAAVCLALGLGAPALGRVQASARHPVTVADRDAALVALATLRVRGPDEHADAYERSEFGTAWADVDRNGCDTRQDVLRRDLVAVTLDPADACVVLSGSLADPYTGRTIPFLRGERSADVQIDHVVALADAWASGAAQWSPDRRERFANDPANLLAVDGPANEDKGASDAAQWLPPDPGYGCVYAVRQVRVKAAYGLSVASDERAALAAAIGSCTVTR
ncbi:HNH endonuclease family protein [Cellulomonas composti]|uniref:GmrSD restriction endonucleases C-terminal domain-containing protein n=1 Tax=Cellulomonas composti TaxID=266130 RepID=A0A511J831_9CELL|nr:HNH endonuclease family protein [Cellulomonas composti]GEL94160.1 hypothetical protein CCO02nite_08180 [Cellulomonas composti]